MLRFGIIGCGNIALRFLKGCTYVSDVEVTAGASRDLSKAKEFCMTHGIPYAYGSYEDLLKADTTDAVYIATPPFTHYQLVKEALQHNKHVLCEKPFVATSDQVEELFAMAKLRGLMLMEAMKAVFTPTTQKVKDWITDGRIGELKYAEASYSYRSPFGYDHWVFDPNAMGGGMLDVGVYAIAYLNHVIDSPIEKHVSLQIEGDTGCDEIRQIVVKYRNGVMGSMRGGIGVKTKNIAYFYGTKGYIEVEDFWKSKVANLIVKDTKEVYAADFESEFTFQIEHFANCIKNGTSQSPVMNEAASKSMIDLINGTL